MKLFFSAAGLTVITPTRLRDEYETNCCGFALYIFSAAGDYRSFIARNSHGAVSAGSAVFRRQSAFFAAAFTEQLQIQALQTAACR